MNPSKKICHTPQSKSGFKLVVFEAPKEIMVQGASLPENSLELAVIIRYLQEVAPTIHGDVT